MGGGINRWFRFYPEALRNPKVLSLSDKEFRLWVRLLCIAAENDGELGPLDQLKLVLSTRLDHLSTGVERLVSAGLIDPLARGYRPHNWDKFQYKSDTSTDRVRRFRKRSETLHETGPDTEAETEVPEAKASGADVQVVDAETVMWRHGRLYLTANGVTEAKAGSVLGKWKREQGAEAVIVALGKAQREGAIDPISYIEGCFRQRRREDYDRDRITV